MGCLDASSMLTVVMRVSDQLLIGPNGVLAQSKWRIRPAISPEPIIRDSAVAKLTFVLRRVPAELRDEDVVGLERPIFSTVSYLHHRRDDGGGLSLLNNRHRLVGTKPRRQLLTAQIKYNGTNCWRRLGDADQSYSEP